MQRSWIIVGVVLWAGIAAAQPDEARAKALYQAGSEAYQAGRYDVAIDAFEAALELVERPALVFSIAQAYRLRYTETGALETLEKAVSAYRRYLELVPEGERRAHATQHLSVLSPTLEARRIEGTAGAARERPTTFIVTSTVEGAQVRIDDGEPQPAPGTFEVTPGKHFVEVTAPGYLPVREAHVAVKGERVPVSMNPAPTPAKLTVKAPAGARIAVSDQTVGEAPLAQPVELLPGGHTLVVSDRGRVPFAERLQLGNGESVTVEVELEPTGQRLLAWSLIGVGGALLAGAGVTTGLALAAESDAQAFEDRRDTTGLTDDEYDTYQSLEQDRDQWRDVTIGLGVGAVVVGVAGVLLYIFDNPTPPRGVATGRGAAAVFTF